MVFFTIIIVTKYFLGIEKCPLFENGVANGTAPGWDLFEGKDETNPNSLRDDYLRIVLNTKFIPFRQESAFRAIFKTNKAHLVHII